MTRLAFLYTAVALLVTVVGGFAPMAPHETLKMSRSAVHDRLPTVYVLDAATATPFEVWCVSRLEKWHSESITIKCPFFRRRAADFLDALDMIARFLVIRHKSLDLDILPPIGSRTVQTCPAVKTKNLELTEIADIIQRDWKVHNNKSYYITGRLTQSIYREDCVFDGPDPDMPVKGLRKYLNAASQLFDQGKSSAELLELTIQPHDKTMTARWKMCGVLRLPWKPSLPEWTGSTTYFLDEDSLVYEHREQWDISVAEAFTKTITPWLGARIWDEHCSEEKER